MGAEVNGTLLHPEKGALYSINKTLQPKKEVSPVSISNGIAWNPEETIMYYIDSPTQKIFSFDYDKAKGTIGKKLLSFQSMFLFLLLDKKSLILDRLNNLFNY